MGNKKVETIPAKRETVKQEKMKRAAAYCRVSTDMAAQEGSFEAQKQYYEAYIGRKPGWELAGIYADKGISGTHMKNRPGFRQLLADCEKGRVDIIVTKSISRFSRNTVDFLETIRALGRLGVAVYFEKEDINTLSAAGEMMLTILSSIAQAEAEAVSSNLKWGIQRRFETGTFRQCTALGYDYDGSGQLAVNETEAETVRLIFQSYLDGMGSGAIAKMLAQNGRNGKNGSPMTDATIRYILKNEVYTGALLCQKTFTTELPERKKKWNNGEVQMYLIEDDHEAVITKEDFEAVQGIMARRGENLQSGRRYLFSGKILCGDCGGVSCRRVVSGEVFWICGNHIKRKTCRQPLGGKVREKDIRQAFAQLCGKLIQNKSILEGMCGRFAEMGAALRQAVGSPDIRDRIAGLERQEQALSQMLADGYLDPAFYIPERNRIQAEREELEAALDASGSSVPMWKYARQTKKIITALSRPAGSPRAFDETLFTEIVEKVIVDSQTEVRFCLTNGLAIKERIGAC